MKKTWKFLAGMTVATALVVIALVNVQLEAKKVKYSDLLLVNAEALANPEDPPRGTCKDVEDVCLGACRHCSTPYTPVSGSQGPFIEWTSGYCQKPSCGKAMAD